MTKTQYHRLDSAIVQGKKSCTLSQTEGVIFYNLWSRRPEWVSLENMMIRLDGRKLYNTEMGNLMRQHIFNIRFKLKGANISCEIQNQRHTAWSDSKYRVIEHD